MRCFVFVPFHVGCLDVGHMPNNLLTGGRELEAIDHCCQYDLCPEHEIGSVIRLSATY
jgi:hypothetical protein